ncbi:hypothetical protein WME96_43900 [Sorangium sp. So ce406]
MNRFTVAADRSPVPWAWPPMASFMLSVLPRLVNRVDRAGAVVPRDLPAGVLAVGNPARVIRSLDSAEARAAAVQGHTRG